VERLEAEVAAFDEALDSGTARPEDAARTLKAKLWACRRRLVRARRRAERGPNREAMAELDRLIAALDRDRMLVNAAVEAYFARESARTNAVVKTLSLATAVLMPLSLIAAVYGMNFRHLPGRDHPLGFWAVTGAMGLLAGGLLWWFRRRRWW
jgi:Mg2+ and Co2+ transporter CorA